MPQTGVFMGRYARGTVVWAVCGVTVCAAFAPQIASAQTAEDHVFSRDVAPFLERYCTDCHGGSDPEAKLALDRYQESGNVQEDYDVWEKVLSMLTERHMPPAEETQPTEAEIHNVLRSIRAELETFDCSQVHRPGRVTIRRLNRVEYNNTIHDLLGIDFEPAADFPSDDVGHGFDNIGDVLSMPPILMEKYLAAAEEAMDRAFADEQARARILAHEPESDGDRFAVFRRNLLEFAERAYRRPLSERESERLFEFTGNAFRSGLRGDDVVKAAGVAILVSPDFLFRIERDPSDDDEDGIRELDDWELATRLSYFLWSSMPDDELFAVAESGQLHEPEVLREQVARMLRDAKSQALVDNFAGQWLQLRDLSIRKPDPDLFPAFDEQLADDMRKETEAFVSSLIREDRSVLEFLNADFSYVNERLAALYGIDGVTGDEFRRVDLPEQRRGVLTQASILLITSNPTRTSPVKRGKWILENILGEPPPPPPANVPPLDEDAEVLGTLRERMEQHRSNESCAVCHRQMDAIGFGLENFDAIGAWRERDGRDEIDPSGVLPGGVEFSGPGNLMETLVERRKDAFCRCLAEKLLTYALGRGLESYDRCAVDGITSHLADNNYTFSELVNGIVMSEPFRLRERPGVE